MKLFKILLLVFFLNYAFCGTLCLDDQDVQLINGTDAKVMWEKLSSCAKKCLERTECLMNCIQAVGYTKPCASCYTFDSQCVAKQCFVICSINDCKPACYTCIDKYCTAAFKACSDDSYGISPMSPYGSSYEYKFGSYPNESGFSSSLEQYMFDRQKESPTVGDYIEHKSPIFKDLSFKEEEEKSKECVEFLVNNGYDFLEKSKLEEIARRNNFDIEKSFSDLESFKYGHNYENVSNVEKILTSNEQRKNLPSEVNPNDFKLVGMGEGFRNGYETPVVREKFKPIVKKKKKKPKRKGKRNQNLNPNDMITRDKRNKSSDNISRMKTKEDEKLERCKSFTSKKTKNFQKTVRKYKKPKFEQDTDKTRLNIVIIGHVDAGKSTMMGNLLFQSGNIDQKVVHKFERESKVIGKPSFYLAWILDEEEEERNHGVTIDVGVKYFETNARIITILDSPGHSDFVPNMIMGAAQADVALVVVDSVKGAFESGFRNFGQTREHLLIARCLGIKQVIVAVNKMDCVDYSKDRYNEIRSKLSVFMKKIGFREKRVFYIPVSGLKNDNLIHKSDNLGWYNGPSLIDQMNVLNPIKRDKKSPLRMCISDVYKTVHTGITIALTIDCGNVSKGEQLMVMPIKEIFTVKNIFRNKKIVTNAYAGDNVELSITGIEYTALQIGQIICEPTNPIKYVTKFKTTIITFNMEIPIIKGSQVIVHLQNSKVSGVILKLLNILNKKQQIKKKKPRILTKNTTANIIIAINSPIGMELYKENKIYGRIVLRRSGRTIASGIVVKILESTE